MPRIGVFLSKGIPSGEPFRTSDADDDEYGHGDHYPSDRFAQQKACERKPEEGLQELQLTYGRYPVV